MKCIASSWFSKHSRPNLRGSCWRNASVASSFDDDTLNEDLIQRIRRHGRPAHLGILAVGPLELFAVADGLAVETGRRAQSCGHRNTGGSSGYVRSPIDD